MEDSMWDHDDDDLSASGDRQDDGTAEPPAEPARRPLSERNIAAFKRLMGAEERLYQWWEQHHSETTWITELLGYPSEEESNLWIADIGERVAAMGGHLELTAVFENETLNLVREPGPEAEKT